ncbi:MAG: ATP-binding protein [Chitinophagales bacterium]|nr:ATP-binding protein [Chitinophagales bacterium]
MIIEFSFGNFRSFKTMETLSMLAANIVARDRALDESNTFAASDKLKLLHSKAIYGANASGKSNIVKAIFAFVQIVKNSVKNENTIKHHVQPFELNAANAEEPTYFQLMFMHQNVPYSYGFEVDKGVVVSEWLFGSPKGRVVSYFTREGNEVSVKNAFKSARPFVQLSKNDSIVGSSALFLTTLSALNNKVAKDIINTISEIVVLSNLKEPIFKYHLIESVGQESTKKRILALAKSADIDLVDLNIVEKDKSTFLQQFPEEVREMFKDINITELQSIRHQYADNGEITGKVVSDYDEWESEGTKKILALSPILMQVLSAGSTLIIDEFDSRLHPNLSEQIVSLFNHPSTNPKHAQLIFVTHNTSFLKPDKLRRDQICLVSKNRYGNSTLSTLVEFKGIRNDASYDKEYRQGAYGSIPFLNNFAREFTQD